MDESSKFIYRPSGKGKRIVMIGALSEDGWVGTEPEKIESMLAKKQSNDAHTYGSIQFWIADGQNKDYHGNFNSATFLSYFKDKLLAKLEKKSIIILDNATYHRIYGPDVIHPKRAKKMVTKLFGRAQHYI